MMSFVLLSCMRQSSEAELQLACLPPSIPPPPPPHHGTSSYPLLFAASMQTFALIEIFNPAEGDPTQSSGRQKKFQFLVHIQIQNENKYLVF